uniref:Chemokine interleukin-8-like domain-containing protein n=1 Tax=Electrophorus electricus TaxID=8005 RepID=A0A4W4DQR3_ELEEL
MKTIATFILICLLVADIKGQARHTRGRCLCGDSGLKVIRVNRVEKVEILSPSPSCDKQEIIVTLKDTMEQKCLNPESGFVQNLIKKMQKRSVYVYL